MDEALARRIVKTIAGGARQCGDIVADRCDGGGNNRVFRVSVDGTSVVAKKYSRKAAESHDRFKAEVEFLRYTRTLKLDCVPELLYADAENGIALFEHVEGMRPRSGDVSRAHVHDALEFFVELNHPEQADAARHLSPAAESCFSVAGHLNLVQRRMARLAGIPRRDETDVAAAAWIQDALWPRWEEVKRTTAMRAEALDVSVERVLADSERCVSPSDFGFHNALIRRSGRLCFVDFEYAGWDDPAKMVADFFCQPEVPVPKEHLDEFVGVAMGSGEVGAAGAARARLLLPVYQIKWICIVLNEFLVDSARRRRFANPDMELVERKHGQLQKARGLLEEVNFAGRHDGVH